jgi:hypothetical protein
MGAVLQPLNSDLAENNSAEEKTLTAVAQIERLADYSLPRALSQIVMLEAEVTNLVADVRALRLALARSEHRMSNQEQLLRNAKIREFQLRAQMARELG